MGKADGKPGGDSGALRTELSRRRTLALMVGAGSCLPDGAAAADGSPPIRLAISDSVVGDVNLNDARAAMLVWTRRLVEDLNVAIDPKLFNTKQEIVDRVRKGQVDAVAVNLLEFRQIAEFLDASQIVASRGPAGPQQYLIVVNEGSGIRELGDLKGRRLCMLKTPVMCVAPAWLSMLLDEGHHPPAEQFFASTVTDAKFSRVVLPVFFGQADACLTNKRGFDTMCELNPQVASGLKAIAVSPLLVVAFYIFRKNYQSPNRERFIKAIQNLTGTPAGRQLATLFQFDDLGPRDGTCLTPALSILEAADRTRARRGAGGRKG